MAETNREANANSTQDHPNNRIVDDRERFKELRKVIVEQQVRIETLQTGAFQLANYYFVFQGVILAAISNTTSLVCSDAWFVFLISLLAAILNFFALLSIGKKYIRVMNLHDTTWSEYNALEGRLSNRNNFQDHHHENMLEIGSDRFSQVRRYVVLVFCMAMFAVFTGVMLSGPWRIICKHDKDWRRHQQGLDCFKLCNGLKCMKFCYEA